MGTVGTPTRHRGRRRVGLLAMLALALCIGVALLPAGAGAVHDINVFELDGNAIDDPAVLGDDWSTLFPTNTSTTVLGEPAFVTDKTGADDDGFGSGLTKDTSDVTEWTTVTGAISPEKDDILHAYAATYVSGGQQYLYFGQDRAPKPNGSTSMGFWFFQDNVAPDGAGGFTGQHQDGDILVTSDMTQGGAVSVVNIFRWENGGLIQIASLTDADCGDDPTPDTACGIANAAPITVPWDYPTDTVPANIFFEGGINLSALFPEGQGVPCFSSFLANTRTSPSETADLKDFVTGSINTCGKITIHKDAQPDDEQDFGYTTTGNGLSSFTLDDDGDNSAGDDHTNTQVFNDLTPGSYSVTETLPLPTGWTLANLSCTTSGPGTSATTSVVTGTATITLGLVGNVDCTYVNTFVKATPTVATDIHNADHQVITSAPIGSIVHDLATVSTAAGFPAPTGSVSFNVYLGNTTCSGSPTAAGSVALAAGVAHSSDNATVPAGGLSYKASYPGD
jgi:hypothetical protein